MTASKGTVAWLAVLLVANVVLGWAWMERNGFLARPLPMEYAATRSHAVELLLAAERGPAAAAAWLAHYRFHHGPTLAVSAGLVGLARGDRVVGPVSTWITSCAVFGTLLLVGTWRLATGIGLSRRHALAATVLCAAAPVVACYQRVFFHQMPMAALVTLAIGEMTRSAGFTKLGPSLRAGLLVGLAGLAKNIAPIYLAGPALAEILLHRPEGRWRRACLGAGAGLAVAAALILPWLMTSRAAISGYAEWGINEFAGPGPWWAPDRWIYAPREAINNGFGLIPSLVLFGLLFAPRSRSGADLRAPLAQIAVSYPILALSQPVCQSTFLLSWMPVFSIAAVELLRRCSERSPRVGRVFGALLLAGALVDVALVQRGLYEDRAGRAILGIELPPKTDHYLVSKVVASGAIASSHPEHWPEAEFAEAILHAPIGRTSVVLGTHQFMCAENLRCHALVQGRDIQPRALFAQGRSEWPRDLAVSDWFVWDDQYGKIRTALEFLAANGVRAEPVLRLPVIGERAVTLVRVLHGAADSRAPR